MNVRDAIAILNEKFPDQKVGGTPVNYRRAYAFSLIPKKALDGTPNWDSTITLVDKESGKVSQFNVFGEPAFLTDATPIDEEP